MSGAPQNIDDDTNKLGVAKALGLAIVGIGFLTLCGGYPVLLGAGTIIAGAVAFLWQSAGRFAKKILPVSPDSVWEEEDYRAAHEFKVAYIPKNHDKFDYGWVAEYARYIYEKYRSVHETLDRKAESLIRLLGGGSGLISLGTILNRPKIGPWLAVTLGASVVFAVCAVVVAAWMRRPSISLMPPSVAWALRYVDAYDAESENRFLGQWHLTCEGMRLAARVKADGVLLSTKLGILAVLCVGISFFTALVTIDPSQPPQSDGRMATQSSGEPGSSPAPPAPNPTGVPQTPRTSAGDPASIAGPQSITKEQHGGIKK